MSARSQTATGTMTTMMSTTTTTTAATTTTTTTPKTPPTAGATTATTLKRDKVMTMWVLHAWTVLTLAYSSCGIAGPRVRQSASQSVSQPTREPLQSFLFGLLDGDIGAAARRSSSNRFTIERFEFTEPPFDPLGHRSFGSSPRPLWTPRPSKFRFRFRVLPVHSKRSRRTVLSSVPVSSLLESTQSRSKFTFNSQSVVSLNSRYTHLSERGTFTL